MSYNEQFIQSGPSRSAAPWLVLAVVAVLAAAGFVGYSVLSGATTVAGHGIGATALPVAAHPSVSKPSKPTKASLAAVNVQLTDLPGWTSSVDTGDDETPAQNAADNRAMSACLGVKIGGTVADQTGEAESLDYDRGSVEVSSDVESYRSQADVNADEATLRNPKAARCLQKVFRKDLASGLPDGATFSRVTFQLTRPGAGQPTNLVGIMTMIGTVTYAGHSGVVHEINALISGPLIEANLVISSLGAAPSTALVTRLEASVAARAAAA